MAPSLASSITARIADTALGVVTTNVEVTAVERLTEHYTEVELSAASFRTVSWAPGQKLQIRPEAGTLAFRTYTPMGWDGDAGSTRVLAYSHGDGPGAVWFRTAEVGATIAAFGPRRSVDLGSLGHHVVFAGDETSVGLAVALRQALPDLDVAHVLEANEPDETADVLTRHGLAGSTVVVPKADDPAALLDALGTAIRTRTSYDLVLSGDAASVAAVRRWVKTEGHAPGATKAKAYWAAGRTGLD